MTDDLPTVIATAIAGPVAAQWFGKREVERTLVGELGRLREVADAYYCPAARRDCTCPAGERCADR